MHKNQANKVSHGNKVEGQRGLLDTSQSVVDLGPDVPNELQSIIGFWSLVWVESGRNSINGKDQKVVGAHASEKTEQEFRPTPERCQYDTLKIGGQMSSQAGIIWSRRRGGGMGGVLR